MSNEAIFWPMIVHAFLVLFLYGVLITRRTKAVRSGHAKISQFRENRHEPAASITARNAVANQFELPVLFYVATILLYMVNADNVVTIGLAWIFALSRYVHAFIHLTNNRLRYRRPAFFVGYGAVVLMWVWLAVWVAMS
ncbi:MAPEG family protein [Sinorhizobium sp. BG8]|uniref:MAPEG family protein n=1 Tax=Sinorhizobium sp. BG8 TaxID=2613773 RepID=UPI00193CCD4B|nr:MAPEG family protein [Sinorhizobium sp. BG8]QRM54433.1 hypothetical protein F3Y30_07660 [Sinorhizobium sp. BG8]